MRGRDIPIALDRDSHIPLAAHLATQIRTLITSGALAPGDAIPSTRTLAAQLTVSRGTVVAAYDQLIAEGFLLTRPRGATTVHPGAGALNAPHPSTQPSSPSNTPADHNSTTSPVHRQAQSPLTDPAWREAWRKAASQPLHPGDNPIPGVSRLRDAVADHLRHVRLMPVNPADVLITAGAREGLLLTILAADLKIIAVESPGYPGLHRVIDRLGVTTCGARVDAHGVIPEELPTQVDAVLLTPNHLYPAGGSMPASRRRDVLHHAAQGGALVLEDDLDADYRHVGPMIPTLWSAAPDQVVHVGTFRHVLSEHVRLGYVIAPPHLHDAVKQVQRDLGLGASAITQYAVAQFLASGGLRRRIARRRRELVRRRTRIIDAVEHCPAWSVEVRSGGHALVRGMDQDGAERLIQGGERVGIPVMDVAAYWGNADADSGLVISYAYGDEQAWDELVRLLHHCGVGAA